MKNLISLLSCLSILLLLLTSNTLASEYSDYCSVYWGLNETPFTASNIIRQGYIKNDDVPFYSPCHKYDVESVHSSHLQFTSRMQFTVTDGRDSVTDVQHYSNRDWSEEDDWSHQDSIEYQCFSDCWGYYTHEHAIEGGSRCTLSVISLWSNFPNPKYDDGGWDDVQWCWVQTKYGNKLKIMHYQAEVVVEDQNFPIENEVYRFKTIWHEVINGDGIMEETPGISIRSNIWDYNTWSFINPPAEISYSVAGQDEPTRSKNRTPAEEGVPVTLVTTATQIVTKYESGSPQTLTIMSWQNTPVVQVKLGATHFSSIHHRGNNDGESSFIGWSKNLPKTIESIQKQRGVSGAKALTIVTFERPVSIEQIEVMFSEDEIADFTKMSILFYDPFGDNKSSLDAKIVNSAHYENVINDIIVQTPELADYKMGLTTVRTWLDLNTIRQLNFHPDVYLADASPTYLRLEASDSIEVQDIQAMAEISAEDVDISFLGIGNAQDGVNDLIVPQFINVYEYSPTEESPTSVFTKQLSTHGQLIGYDKTIFVLLMLTILTVAFGKSHILPKR